MPYSITKYCRTLTKDEPKPLVVDKCLWIQGLSHDDEMSLIIAMCRELPRKHQDMVIGHHHSIMVERIDAYYNGNSTYSAEADAFRRKQL